MRPPCAAITSASRFAAASSGCLKVSPATYFWPLCRKMRVDSGSVPSILLDPSISPCNTLDMTNPSRANFTAGSTNWAQGLLPYFSCAKAKPDTEPGTPEDRHPKMLSFVGLPSGPIYISRVAFCGASSRKSRNVVLPLAKRISMNPPPPRLPAVGCVTASAKPTAIAASMALPPAFNTASPASAASGSCATTMPCLYWIGDALKTEAKAN